MQVVKIFSQTCGPCKVLEQNLQKSGIKYISVDVASDRGDEYIEEYGIRNVPTLLLINDDGTEIKRHTGILTPEECKSFIICD